MKIALGTVQFGLNYGISNVTGMTPFDEVKSILDYAYDCGIQVLDTSAAYGKSEEVLGTASAAEKFQIITKVYLAAKSPTQEQFASVFETSLKKLKTDKIYGLMIHRPADLLDSPNGKLLYKYLLSLKEIGVVNKIGISIYEKREIDEMLESFPVDLVQLPFNVLDQSLHLDGYFDRLKAKGIEIHCRSVFLQGLLLAPVGSTPERMSFAKPYLAQFHKFVLESGLTPLEYALKYVISIPEIDQIVVGVNSKYQLEQIMNSAKEPTDFLNWGHLNCEDPRVIRPNLWPQESK